MSYGRLGNRGGGAAELRHVYDEGDILFSALASNIVEAKSIYMGTF